MIRFRCIDPNSHPVVWPEAPPKNVSSPPKRSEERGPIIPEALRIYRDRAKSCAAAAYWVPDLRPRAAALSGDDTFIGDSIIANNARATISTTRLFHRLQF